MTAQKKKIRNCVDCGVGLEAKRFRKPIEDTRCYSCAAKAREDRSYMEGSNNRFWKGGVITRYGYKYIHKPSHPKALKNGYVKRANLIWEQSTGYYPDNGKVLHHKDGDRLNDNLGNLQLMTHSEHHSLHSKGTNNPAYKHGKYVGKNKKRKSGHR